MKKRSYSFESRYPTTEEILLKVERFVTQKSTMQSLKSDTAAKKKETLEAFKHEIDLKESRSPFAFFEYVPDYDDLMAMNYGDFLYWSYRAVLNRVPDKKGMQGYLDGFKQGLSKEQVLDQIMSSDEAKAVKSRIKGMRRRKLMDQLENVPLLGAIFCVLFLPWAFQHRQKNRREFERHIVRRQYFFAEEVDKITRKLHEITGKYAAAIEENRTRSQSAGQRIENLERLIVAQKQEIEELKSRLEAIKEQPSSK